MSGARSTAVVRAAVWIWSTLSILASVGLLAVGAYVASASPTDGPSATPFLMLGLLVLCIAAMTVTSVVAAAVVGRGARVWIRILLVALSLVLPWLLLPLVAAAGDPNESSPTRWTNMSLFVIGVLLLFAWNAVAVHRQRRGH